MGEYVVQMHNEEEPEIIGIDFEIDNIADAGEGRDLTASEKAQLAALNDAKGDRLDREVARRPEYEPSFAEMTKQFLDP